MSVCYWLWKTERKTLPVSLWFALHRNANQSKSLLMIYWNGQNKTMLNWQFCRLQIQIAWNQFIFVKLLNFDFNKLVLMDKQITCKSALFFIIYISNIVRMTTFISFKNCETLIHALVPSKLDYWNFLLSGLSQNQIQRLQYVQNSAACVSSFLVPGLKFHSIILHP